MLFKYCVSFLTRTLFSPLPSSFAPLSSSVSLSFFFVLKLVHISISFLCFFPLLFHDFNFFLPSYSLLSCSPFVLFYSFSLPRFVLSFYLSFSSILPFHPSRSQMPFSSFSMCTHVTSFSITFD